MTRRHGAARSAAGFTRSLLGAHSAVTRMRRCPQTAPQREAVWRELRAAQLDYINTDHLAALRDFLQRRRPQPPGRTSRGDPPRRSVT